MGHGALLSGLASTHIPMTLSLYHIKKAFDTLCTVEGEENDEEKGVKSKPAG